MTKKVRKTLPKPSNYPIKEAHVGDLKERAMPST
jgi:hypothetical protein